jgi:hypothetical protein
VFSGEEYEIKIFFQVKNKELLLTQKEKQPRMRLFIKNSIVKHAI